MVQKILDYIGAPTVVVKLDEKIVRGVKKI
jgi:hypothetical protein